MAIVGCTNSQYIPPTVFVSAGNSCGDGVRMESPHCVGLPYSIYGGGVRYWYTYNPSNCNDWIIIEWYQSQNLDCSGGIVATSTCARNTCCTVTTPYRQYSFNNDMGVIITSTQTTWSTVSVTQTVTTGSVFTTTSTTTSIGTSVTTSFITSTMTSISTTTMTSLIQQFSKRRYCMD